MEKFSLKSLDYKTKDKIDADYPVEPDTDRIFRASYEKYRKSIDRTTAEQEIAEDFPVEVINSGRPIFTFNRMTAVMCAAVAVVLIKLMPTLPDYNITPPDNVDELPVIAQTGVSAQCTTVQTAAVSTARSIPTAAPVTVSEPVIITAPVTIVEIPVTEPVTAEPVVTEPPVITEPVVTTAEPVVTEPPVTTVTKSAYEQHIEENNTLYTPAPELVDLANELIAPLRFDVGYPNRFTQVWIKENSLLELEAVSSYCIDIEIEDISWLSDIIRRIFEEFEPINMANLFQLPKGSQFHGVRVFFPDRYTESGDDLFEMMCGIIYDEFSDVGINITENPIESSFWDCTLNVKPRSESPEYEEAFLNASESDEIVSIILSGEEIPPDKYLEYWDYCQQNYHTKLDARTKLKCWMGDNSLHLYY